MKNFLIALLLGAIGGGAVVWYVTGSKEPLAPAPSTAPPSRAERTLEDIKQSVSETADSVRTALDAKLDFLGLRGEQVKRELSERGRVVRSQSREWLTELKGTALDAKITTEIKGKYALDREVSALNISVNTTDGVVTLAGTAPSYDAISRAILMAMETEGVRQVVSTIQVK